MKAQHHLPLLLSLLLLAGCSSSSGPVDEAVPEGIFHRITSSAEGVWHHGLRLEPDSAFLYDTLFVDVGGTMTVDSISILRLELDPSADGYFRAVEEEMANGTDITDRSLRYWYFFQKLDTLYYYRGMRFRGDHISLVGEWNTSAADSAYLGMSYRYLFTDDSVEVTTQPGDRSVRTTYTVHDAGGRRTLEFGTPVAPFGPRFEIVPGLALYLTSTQSPGYLKVADIE